MRASPRHTLCRHGATDFYPSSDIQRNPFTSGLGCVIEEDQRIYSPAAVAAQALGCRIKKRLHGSKYGINSRFSTLNIRFVHTLMPSSVRPGILRQPGTQRPCSPGSFSFFTTSTALGSLFFCSFLPILTDEGAVKTPRDGRDQKRALGKMAVRRAL